MCLLFSLAACLTAYAAITIRACSVCRDTFLRIARAKEFEEIYATATHTPLGLLGTTVCHSARVRAYTDDAPSDAQSVRPGWEAPVGPC
jgi:hypothetical protein